jgi:hypothetical protein
MKRPILILILLLLLVSGVAGAGLFPRGVGNSAANITSVTVTPGSFLGGSADGTSTGAIAVTLSQGTFTGTIAMGSCSQSADFRLSASTLPANLLLNGTQAAGNYTACITPTQAGAGQSGTPFPVTITGTVAQTIASITPTSCSFTAGTQNGAVCNLSVTMSPASPASTAALSLTGANSGAFHLSGTGCPNISLGTCTIQQSASVGGTTAGTYTDVSAVATQSTPLAAEEFVGPFASWACVRSSASGTCGAATAAYYNAVGNGATDDTTAIQNCLTALNGTTVTTCYFPAGSYKITSTLTLTGLQDINLIGADPATTSIVWAGSSGGTMLDLAGVAYSRFDRLTFDAQSLAGIAIDQSWSGSGNYFDTGNEYADDVIKNTLASTGIGYRCGALGSGCAETALLRDTFQNHPSAAVSLQNSNALDEWIWYSSITGSGAGSTNGAVTNQLGAGHFSVFNSYFHNPDPADDIGISAAGIMTFMNNYSDGAPVRFLHCAGSGNASNLSLAGNTILDVTGVPIRCDNFGPLVVMDHTIRAKAVSPSANAVYMPSAGADLFSLGNTYSVSTAACGSVVASGGRCHSTGDQVVNRNTINPTPPVLPGVPPNNRRTIYEVTAGSSASTIQTAINNAVAASPGSVVHLQAGAYSIGTTLTVAANATIQIIGDGQATVLTWSGGAAGKVFQLTGPSKVVMRDLQINGNSGAATGVDVTNSDQTGARVFGEGLLLQGSTTANLFVDALDNTLVELHDYLGTLSAVDNIRVTGGSSAAGGTWLGGQTNIFAGAAYGNATYYNLSANGHLNVRQVFNDNGGTSTKIASLSGTGGAFSIMGMGAFLSSGSNHSVTLNNFSGTSALVNYNTSQSVVPGDELISGTGTGANNLNLGSVGITPTPFTDTTSGSADTNGFLDAQSTASATSTSSTRSGTTLTVGGTVTGTWGVGETLSGSGVNADVITARGTGTGGTGTYTTNNAQTIGTAQAIGAGPASGTGAFQVTESGVSTLAFLNTAFTPLRSAQPTVPGALAAGITDVRLYRVATNNCIYGVHLEH